MYSRRFQFSELPKDYSIINSMYIVEHHINDFFRLVCKYYDKDYQKNKSHTIFPDRKYYMTMADGKLGECSRKKM